MRDTPDTGREARVRDGQWLALRLARKVRETPLITSVYLEAPDGGPLPPFRAGQYLTISVPQEEGAPPVLRTYTISSAPSDRQTYRLTVKREAGSETDGPPGIGSTYLHDALAEGDMLTCLPPRGGFVLDDSTRPVVLLSGGVGITPMLAMLAELTEQGGSRPVWFVHACRDSRHRVLSDEIAELARRHGQVRLFSVLEEADEDAAHVGRIDMAFLKAHLPFDDYSFYLCGPPGFMASLFGGLTSLNVAEDRIAYEFFGPATVLKSAKAPLPERSEPARGAAVSVEFSASGETVDFSDTSASILDLAREAGLDVVYSCEEGICGTCRCRLLSGEVEYLSEPIAFLEEGEILTCISRPKTDISLDL